MKYWQIPILAVTLATGLLPAAPMHAAAEPEAVVTVETQAENASATGEVRGRIQLPAQGKQEAKTHGLAVGDVIVRVESVLKLSRYPTPDNWEKMTRDEQLTWAKAFRETEAYHELVRQNEAARASRVIKFVEVGKDGVFELDGLKPMSYVLQALIKSPNAGDRFSKGLSLAYKTESFKIESAEQAVDLGDVILELQKYLAPGELAPEWTATAYDGSKVSLSDYRGKYVLVDFWATWCGPCKAEVPNLEAVYADYGGEKFEIIGLSLDATFDLPKRYHENKPSPYTNLYLGKWNEEKTTAEYGISGIPSIWLIGPDGKVVARDLKGKALREAVRLAVEGKAVLETKTEAD